MTQDVIRKHPPTVANTPDKGGFQYSIDVDYNVILGCPRSGTTFLVDALQPLPYSECVTGHLFPLAIAHLVNQPLAPEVYGCLSRSFEFSVQDFLESIDKARVPAIYKWLSRNMSTPELIEAIKRTRTLERVIYKEPFLVFAPEFTYNALPNCQVIHIYRDGRDCADSLMRKYQVLTDEKLTSQHTAEMPLGRKYDHRYVPWWVEAGREEEFLACTPYVRAVWMWKEMTRRCHDFFSRPDVAESGRVLLLKYEDLVSDPMRYGEQVANHFGCQMTPRLSKLFSGAHGGSVGVHQRRSAEEIRAANQIAETELAIYGYLEA